MTVCPRCGRRYHHEISILRDDGIETAFAHIGDEGEVDMCHSDVLALPQPYFYDECTRTVFRRSEVLG